MANVGLVTSAWSGTTGGPGVTTLAVQTDTADEITASEAQAMVNRVRTFWDSLKGVLPNEVTITVSPTIDQFDVASGTLLTSTNAATAPTGVTGTQTGGFAGGVGARIDWETGAVSRGRRVRGRTYVVPAVAAVFDIDGSLTTANQTAITTPATALIAGMVTDLNRLVVWQKPNSEAGYVGSTFIVSNARVPDKSAILRSRRD